jgi:hypothetical protein
VLDAIACENTQGAIVHMNGDSEFKLASWPAEDLGHLRVEVELLGDAIELALGHLKCINLFGHNLLLLFYF